MGDTAMYDINSILGRLRHAGISYRTIDIGEDWSIVVTTYGGRIIGPFKRPHGESLLWLNAAFRSDNEFSKMIERSLPIGGERMWISPEIQFGCTDRRAFWETLFVPQAVDPGDYSIESISTDTVRLFQSIEIEAFNLANGKKKLFIERFIEPIDDPLGAIVGDRPFRSALDFCGYRHTVRLRETHRDGIQSESWSLAQVRPDGTMLFPTKGMPQTASYFGPVPESLVSSHPDRLECRIDGKAQYKIGIHRVSALGRIVYRQRIDNETDRLTVRVFPVDLAGHYADEPPQERNNNGYCCHVYNDDGRFGGFGEMENMGSPIGGENRLMESFDRNTMLFYEGSPEVITSIQQRFV